MDFLIAAGVFVLIISIIGLFKFNDRVNPSVDTSGTCAVVLVVPLIVIVIVAAFIFAIDHPGRVAVLVGVLSALTAAFAWLIKSQKASLQTRAELLIVEGLSRKRMTRSEIRAMIYSDTFMFRIFGDSYVNALASLLHSDRVYLEDDHYFLPQRRKRKKPDAGKDGSPDGGDRST